MLGSASKSSRNHINGSSSKFVGQFYQFSPVKFIQSRIIKSTMDVGDNIESQQRYGLFEHKRKDNDTLKALLEKAIPQNYEMGTAIGEGDCFFDAVAQLLNQKNGKEEYTVKSLRLLCDEYVKDKKHTWVKYAIINDREDYENYLARVQFTAKEMQENDRNKTLSGTATWGRPTIEGKIFCKQIGIEIHVIECREAQENESQEIIHPTMLTHQLIKVDGIFDIEENEVDYNNNNLIHIVVENNHFVPVLKKLVAQEFDIKTVATNIQAQNNECPDNYAQLYINEMVKPPIDVSLLRREFFTKHPQGQDDKKVEQYYQEIITCFNFSRILAKDKKIAFIVVAHFVHTLPYFLEAVSSLGYIAALISKQSSVVKKVRKTITSLYKDIIFEDVNKNSLNDNIEKTRSFFLQLFNNSKLQDCQFIILDHGGYFAPRINDVLLEYKDKIVGIVEHTWNGEVRYQQHLQSKPTNIPVCSIAHSSLKDYESRAVASSIITALKSNVYSGQGINQEINRLECILIIGYGKIGKCVALMLKKELSNKNAIYISDSSEKVRALAIEDFDNQHVSADIQKILPHAELIITATGAKCLSKVDFENMGTDVTIACATSSDDQFEENAMEDFIVDTEKKNTNLVVYKHKSIANKTVYLAANGDSVNFSIGSTSHPILHAILSAVCVLAWRILRKDLAGLDKSIGIYQSDSEDESVITAVYERFFGKVENEKLDNSKVLLGKTQVGFFQPQRFVCNLDFGLFQHEFFLASPYENQQSRPIGLLDEKLLKYQNVVVTGIVGAGKSSYAGYYAYKNQKRFQIIYQIRCDNIKNIYHDLYQLALELGFNERDIKLTKTAYLKIIFFVFNQLEGYDYLLIYDDCDNPDVITQIAKFLPKQRIKPHNQFCIITSQNEKIFQNKEKCILLDGFNDKEAESYLADLSRDVGAIKNLYSYFDKLPLGLIAAKIYLSNNKNTTSVADYLKWLETDERDLVEEDEVEFMLEFYPNKAKAVRCLQRAVKFNIDIVKDLQLLGTVAILAEKAVPLQFINTVIKGAQFNNAVRKLLTCSLCRLSKTHIFIHNVTRKQTRSLIESSNNAQQLYQNAVTMLNTFFDYDIFTWTYKQQHEEIIIHSSYLIQQFLNGKFKFSQNVFPFMLKLAVFYLLEHRNADKAKLILETILKQLPIKQCKEGALCVAYLSYCDMELAKVSSGFEYGIDAINICEILPQNSLRNKILAFVTCTLGHLFRGEKNYHASIEYYMYARKFYRTVFPEESIAVADVNLCLADVCLIMHDFDAAKVLYEDAIEYLIKQRRKSPAIFFIHFALARIKFEDKETSFTEAENEFLHLIEEEKKFYEPSLHDNTASAYCKLGIICFEKNKFEKAEKYLLKSIEIRQTLKEDENSIKNALSYLIQTYQHLIESTKNLDDQKKYQINLNRYKTKLSEIRQETGVKLIKVINDKRQLTMKVTKLFDKLPTESENIDNNNCGF